jgi:hypothetical protein
MVCFRVTDVLSLEEPISEGLSANPANRFAPNNVHVKDWELDRVLAVSRSVIRDYLGVRQAVSTQAAIATAALASDNYSQSITWYAEMAQYLSTNI